MKERCRGFIQNHISQLPYCVETGVAQTKVLVSITALHLLLYLYQKPTVKRIVAKTKTIMTSPDPGFTSPRSLCYYVGISFTSNSFRHPGEPALTTALAEFKACNALKTIALS